MCATVLVKTSCVLYLSVLADTACLLVSAAERSLGNVHMLPSQYDFFLLFGLLFSGGYSAMRTKDNFMLFSHPFVPAVKY